MKVLKVISSIAVIALLFSCNSEKREVERIAQAYLDAETNFRISEARPYVSKKFEPMLNQIENFVLPNISDTVLNSLLPNKVTIKKTELFGDTAIVSFHSSNPSQETDAQVMLVRSDTTWLVVQQGSKVHRGPLPEPVMPQPQPQPQPEKIVFDSLKK